jgi:DNA-binding GntR family transcriptional regulator
VSSTPGNRTTNDAKPPEARGPASQPIYAQIQKMIMMLELEPGQRLTVEALARELEISPTPVREALARLESEGLVTKTHLRGFHVAEQHPRDRFEQMFELRLLVEPRMAANAAERASAEDRQELQDLDAAMHATAEAPPGAETYNEFAALDAQFHRVIAVASGNEVVADVLNRFHVHLVLFRLRRDQGVATRALPEHRRIVEFIVEGDRDLAEAAMLSHLERSLTRVRNAYSSEDRREG